MPTKKEKLEEEMEEKRESLFQSARKVLLASIGAVALAQDELEDFVEKLVERGEIAEKDARKLVREVAEKRKKSTTEDVEKRMEDLMGRMNVPTKADIDSLSAKITELTEKVEQLKKA